MNTHGGRNCLVTWDVDTRKALSNEGLREGVDCKYNGA